VSKKKPESVVESWVESAVDILVKEGDNILVGQCLCTKRRSRYTRRNPSINCREGLKNARYCCDVFCFGFGSRFIKI
jgi:hypothetical protein